MANRGLSSFLYGKLTEGVTNTYEAPKKLTGAIEFRITPNKNTAQIASDNVTKWKTNQFKDANIVLTGDENDDTIFAPILGKTVTEVTKYWDPETKEFVTASGENTETVTIKEVVANTSDIASYVGFARVVKKQTDDGVKFKAIFYPKVLFEEPESNEKTEGEQLEFVPPTVNGVAMPISIGKWEHTATFDKEEQAVAWLKERFKPETV